MDAPKLSAPRRFALVTALFLPVVVLAALMIARTPTLTTPESVCLAPYGPAQVNHDGGSVRVKDVAAETDRRVKVMLTDGCNEATCTAMRRERDWVAEPAFWTLRGCFR